MRVKIISLESHTTKYQKFFVVSAVKLWNETPDDIKKSISIHIFKKEFYCHLLSLQSSLLNV